MRFSSFVLTCLLVSLAGNLAAQFTTLRGTVTDQDSGEPIPYVFLVLKNQQNHGAVSNELGKYELVLTDEHLLDTVVISHLGYHPYQIVLSEIEDQSAPLDIQLKSSVITLSTIEVNEDYDPITLIKRTLANIPNKYGTDRYVLKGYYREYSLNKDGYADFTEAMVAISDSRYLKKRQPATVFVDHLETTGYNGSLSTTLRYGNENPIYTLYEKQSNSARVHNIHWMSADEVDFFHAFDFSRLGVYIGNNDTLVRIGYQINPERAGLSTRALSMLSGWTKGELVINKTDYAIMRNTRGDGDGDAFSEVVYRRILGYYYPYRIFSTRGFKHGLNDLHLQTQMLIITDIANKPTAMRSYTRGTKVPRKKQLIELKHVNTGTLDMNGIYLLDLPTEQALEVDRLRRERQLTLGKGTSKR
ncbi:MAG: carboxypeptidase-like regulatory domain-containing protein [Bacteroidota bacterium]